MQALCVDVWPWNYHHRRRSHSRRPVIVDVVGRHRRPLSMLQPTTSVSHRRRSLYICCCKSHDRSHAGESGVAIKSTIVREVKDKAKANPYRSAYSIAESGVSAAPRVPNQHAVANLGWIRNRHRPHCRPRHPADLMFDLDLDHIPQEFDVGDISVNSKQQIVNLIF